MLYWNANFQIPNSGVQAKDVYAIATLEDKLIVKFYADIEQKTFLFQREYNLISGDPYQYLLSLEEYSNYTRV